MKNFLTTILTFTLIQAFGQSGRLIIGKAYSAKQDSSSNKVYISVQNDLDFTIRNIKLIHGNQSILTIATLRSAKKKCYSFLKSELMGDDIFVLKYGTLVDTLRETDVISYNIHELEISGGFKPITNKERRKREKRENKSEDEYFLPNKCNYRQQKL